MDHQPSADPPPQLKLDFSPRPTAPPREAPPASTGAPPQQLDMLLASFVRVLDDVVGQGFLLVAHEDPMPFLNAGQRAFLAQLGCHTVVLTEGEGESERVPDAVTDLDGAISADATLQLWADGEHTIYNHAAERTAFVADWFAGRLNRCADPRP